ncbi:MAG: uroporphyrinogen-III C-methyltransferase [Woeseiaceae bacterium]
MSETDENEDSVQPDEPVASPSPAPKTRGGGVAWLALLVAAIALAAVAYTIYDDWRTQQDLELSSGNIEASVSTLGGRIDDAREALAAIESELDVLAQADSGIGDEIDGLQRKIDDGLRQFDSLPLRMGNLEASIATLQGVSDGARDTWLLGEAEYYMQLANAQLQLANNPDLAALALGMADERIAQLANPALTNIRIAISDERAALDGMSTPDIEGITLQLASLGRVVETLPLRPIERIEDETSAESDEEQGRLDRAWNSVKQATSGIIKHRTTDEQVMPLISPEAEYFLRTNLSLQMQTARLALLRGEQSVFEESLADAAGWLETYFDASSSQVAAAVASINELRGGMFATAAPDISESLRLLRRHNSVTESAQ